MTRIPRFLLVSAGAGALALALAAPVAAQGDQTRQVAVEPATVLPPKVELKEKAEPATKVAADAEKPAAAAEKEPAAAPAPAAPAAAAPAAVPAAAPAAAVAVVPETLSPQELVVVLQTELHRVGCYLGALDGIWGPQSDYSLRAFGHFGKITATDYAPSLAWLNHVKGYDKVVCPPNYVYQPPGYGGYGGGYGYGYQRGYGGGYGGGYYGGRGY